MLFRSVMSETFETGLARLFSGDVNAPSQTATAPLPVAADTTLRTAPPAAAPSVSPATAQLIREADNHYQRAISAQRAGDWATYGQEIQRLGEILRRLNTGGR